MQKDTQNFAHRSRFKYKRSFWKKFRDRNRNPFCPFISFSTNSFHQWPWLCRFLFDERESSFTFISENKDRMTFQAAIKIEIPCEVAHLFPTHHNWSCHLGYGYLSARWQSRAQSISYVRTYVRMYDTRHVSGKYPTIWISRKRIVAWDKCNLSNHWEQSLSHMYKEYVRKIFVSRVYSTEIVKWSLSEVMCRACRIDYGRPIEICLSNFSTVLTIFFFFQNTARIVRIYQSPCCCCRFELLRIPGYFESLESYFTRKNILKGIKLHWIGNFSIQFLFAHI